MDLSALRERILSDDAFVLDEIQKIRYVYKLKKEIRYALKRQEVIDTESVAEHVFGMHVIANYFLPLEDPHNEWDKQKIFELITWHDIDEIETGDTVSHLKTEQHLQAAKEAMPIVLSNLPDHMQARTSALMHEYEQQTSIEARFTKAIDKSEPLFEIWDDSYKDVFIQNHNTLADHWNTKRTYVKDFPYIMRFVEVATDRLEGEGFFVSEE